MTKEEIVKELKELKKAYYEDSKCPFAPDDHIFIYKGIYLDINSLLMRIGTNDKN